MSPQTGGLRGACRAAGRIAETSAPVEMPNGGGRQDQEPSSSLLKIEDTPSVEPMRPKAAQTTGSVKPLILKSDKIAPPSVLGLILNQAVQRAKQRISNHPPIPVQCLPPVLIDDRAGWRNEIDVRPAFVRGPASTHPPWRRSASVGL